MLDRLSPLVWRTPVSVLLVGLLLTSGPAWACGKPRQLQYRVIDSLPHDPRSFTQGLVFIDDVLAESTGGYGDSKLILHHPAHQESLDLPRRRFGEGLTWFRERLWQLSWKAGELRIYRTDPLRLARSLRYRGEGWGLTHDGEHLYLSDGSAELSVRDPDNFHEIRRIVVRAHGKPVALLNELEWWQDSLLANVWRSDHIVRINPESGCVTGLLDLSGLWPAALRPPQADVLNGIAVHPKSGEVWVTGKRWPRLYRLELSSPGLK